MGYNWDNGSSGRIRERAGKVEMIVIWRAAVLKERAKSS